LRRYAMDKLGIDAIAADRLVSEQNKQREHYVKRHWNRSWLALENYHLCVNTAWLGIDGAAEQGLDAARRQVGGAGGRRESGNGHPERSEGSALCQLQIPRFARDDYLLTSALQLG